MVGPFRPEVAGDVISGRNVKNIEGYDVVVNFEVASSSSFQSKIFKHGRCLGFQRFT